VIEQSCFALESEFKEADGSKFKKIITTINFTYKINPTPAWTTRFNPISHRIGLWRSGQQPPILRLLFNPVLLILVSWGL
jgi:hypothetical protein